jgi:hypothetical protein
VFAEFCWDGDRDSGRVEEDPWEDLAMDGADDQCCGGIDVGRRVDAAELLLGATYP